eukprot:1943715-Pleurochrysis_carterae.AAC.1
MGQNVKQPCIRLRYPPRTSRSEHQRATFMIKSRIGKKSRGGRGLVKKSARLSALRRNGTVMSKDSTFSRTKKCRRSMCLVR